MVPCPEPPKRLPSDGQLSDELADAVIGDLIDEGILIHEHTSKRLTGEPLSFLAVVFRLGLSELSNDEARG